MNTNAILSTALSAGAITSENTPAARALLKAAEADPAAAQQFASRARTPLERVQLVLSVISPGVSLEAAITTTGKMLGKGKDPKQALINAYGG